MVKVFVGTLHSNEGDFKACCEAIKSQIDVDVTHCVISGHNEKDAHNILWDEWRANQSSHDLFVKVDADVVLRSPTTLQEISNAIVLRGATGLQAPLHDYMTDRLISGLNAYTPKVTFLKTTDDVFCDRSVCTDNTLVLYDKDLPLTLSPAGYHCHHATSEQAFRYAIHRAMKKQHEVLQQLIYAWKHYGDRTRGIAVIGTMIAKKFVEKEKNKSDYNDEGFIAAYNDAEFRYDEYISAIKQGNLEIFD